MSKIDCSMTENYLKEKARITKSSYSDSCTINCRDCPLSSDNNIHGYTCSCFEKMHPKEAISIVQKWSDEHPLLKPKTMLEDFLEKFPNARLLSDGTPDVCCARLGYGVRTCMMIDGENCRECWNRPLDVK